MEAILHYVWKYKLYNKQLFTTDGETIEVLDTGLHNTDAGPDFFNAKIKIGDKIWVGNVEIHLYSDDWYKHKHDTDSSYDSVILHLVKKVNKDIFNSQGRKIPQAILSYSSHIDDNYDLIKHSSIKMPCESVLPQLDRFTLKQWLNTLLIERLERKSDHLFQILNRYAGDWEAALYVLLLRNFGFGLNADVFEQLAHSLPITYLKKHADNLLQLEALLLGQAGFLDENIDLVQEDYHKQLVTEYHFLKAKFSLNALDASLFKNLRVRPNASPQIRLAQLAQLFHVYPNLFSRLITMEDLGAIRLLFHVNASSYWQTHFFLGRQSGEKSKYIGNASLDLILINTLVPILFAYGKYSADELLCERALTFLDEIKPETNAITKYFSQLNVPINSSSQSQACIQLKKEYCDKKKCLYCRIGHRMMLEK